jgi:hypothetical protein
METLTSRFFPEYYPIVTRGAYYFYQRETIHHWRIPAFARKLSAGPPLFFSDPCGCCSVTRIKVVHHHVHVPSFRPPEISSIRAPIGFLFAKIVYYFKCTHFHRQTVPQYLLPDTGAQRHCTSTGPLPLNAETPQPSSHTDNTLIACRVFPQSLSGIGLLYPILYHSFTHAPRILLILVSHASCVLVV